MNTTTTVSFTEKLDIVRDLLDENLVDEKQAEEMLCQWDNVRWLDFRTEWDRANDRTYNPETLAA